ncbi:MAG: DUF4402 domain-containing protein [Bacteroidetes bacterium]|nr:DUF4402 domain-containing protein [Bacteroidota bacterium]
MFLPDANKRIFRLWFLTAVLFFCIHIASAQPPLPQHNRNQNVENTGIGTKIVKAISLEEQHALHFGTMTIPIGEVDVTVSTTNYRSASVPANITLLPQNPVSSYAIYNVSGSADATYTISLPPDHLVIIYEGLSEMHIDNFLARTGSGPGVDGFTGKLDASGNDYFTVGATLKLSNSQQFGVYSGIFNVTVAYN